MNKCFLNGKIISEIKFDFILNQKSKISIAEFWIQTNNKVLADEKNEICIKISAFNENADKIYSSYNIGNYILLEGIATNKGVELIKIHNTPYLFDI